MIQTIKTIYDLLQADSALLALLPQNKPFFNPNDTVSSKQNSIIKATMINRKMNTPYVTLGEGSIIRIGENLESETVYIRCYNDVNKSFVEINSILDMIKGLLDKQTLTISDRQLVRVKFEITLDGIVDQELNLKFKESRYRLLVL